ncbi:Golgi transport complex subunit 6 [Spiromyces aspiralis]|uniref:Golgi transport complex subunit 6 n=1 Tax=Spiromyces aspiralis TaxID=68401 RepID=A0ACC1HT61_9FUNG|nr:Golgi transport complex subunit 6 [Spiromyces aspiralis]
MRQLCHLYLLVGYPVSASKPGIDVRGERPQQQQRSQQRGDVLGLDVDRALASYEDAGLKGMRRWASNEIRQLSKDTPEFSAELKRAIHALKRRPALHQTVIQDIANTRCEALAYAFIQALVRGGPNGVPRPIDVHAADPVRYLGDMLAWVHQAHASEIELLDTLFIDKDSDHGHADGDDQAVSDVRLENARCRKDVLSLCLEGLCRPLELRVQQTLLAMSEPTQLLKLINFLQFYSQVFAKTCLPDSALMLTMKDMAAHANETFINVLKTRVLDDTANIEISPTLNVPDGCMAVIDLVRDLINIYDASFGLNHDETSPPREEHGSVEDLQVLSEQQILADIFSLSLDQMVERCQSVASTSNLLDYEATILEWNLHSAIRNMMNANESARSWHEKVTAKLGSLESWLEQQLFELINERSGMKFVLECLDNGQQDSLTPAQILALSTKLSEALATGELDLTVQMGRLHSPKVTKAIIATVMTHFVDAYKRVYGFVEAKIGTDATWDSQVDLGTFHRPHVLATLLL